MNAESVSLIVRTILFIICGFLFVTVTTIVACINQKRQLLMLLEEEPEEEEEVRKRACLVPLERSRCVSSLLVNWKRLRG